VTHHSTPAVLQALRNEATLLHSLMAFDLCGQARMSQGVEKMITF